MNEQKVINLLSMAQRANQIVSGEFAAAKALQEGRAKLLLVAEDASPETKKKYAGLAAKYKVPMYYALTRDVLGTCLGKDFRAAAVILDNGFGKAVEKWVGTAKEK